MQNYRKHTKKVAVALIIILLCMVSLTSITFALFTNGDDGKIGINIAGGDIKIDILDDNEKSLIDNVLSFVNYDYKDDDQNIILMEPGAVFYTEPFAVKNNGDIPVNYIVYINYSDHEKDLVDALEFFIISKAKLYALGSSRENLNAIENYEEMAEHRENLDPNQKGEYYHLVVRMKKEADDRFQGKQLEGIGITVYAVQGNVDIEDVTASTETDINETEISTEVPAETTT